MTWYAFVAAASGALLVASCAALDAPRSRIDGQFLTEMNQNAATLQQTIDYFDIAAPANDCPVCEEDGKDGDNDNRIVQRILSKAGGLLKRTSTFASLQRSLRTTMGRRRYHKSVVSSSTNAIVSILNTTASHFAALDVTARTLLKQAEREAAPTFEIDMLSVLQQVANVSSTVAYDIATVIQRADKVTAGLVTTSALSVLGFLERINLGTTALLVDYLSAWNGANVNNLDFQVTSLRASLSSESTNGVFGDIASLLNTVKDKSGLVTVLTNVTSRLSAIDDRLVQFTSSADASLASGSDVTLSAVVTSKRSDALLKLAGLNTGMTLVSVNAAQSIALTGLDGLGGILVSSAGLIVGGINGILNQSLSTFNAALSLFRTTDTKDTAVSGDIILVLLCAALVPDTPDEFCTNCNDLICFFIWLIPVAIILSPIWITVLVVGAIFNILSTIFGGGSRSDGTTKKISCHREALVCQSAALSAALPSI